MSTFLGIGLGPIQTGIFLSGAFKGGFDRIIIAEVDEALKQAVNASGKVSINIAAASHVYPETYTGIEVYNPMDPADLEKLIAIAAEADELATALPSVNFFKHIAPWLKKGFAMNPGKRRFIYTAENHNHAAEELTAVLGDDFPQTYCLNTVVGKMSGVITAEECAERDMKPLCPGADRGHLVEEFNKILISTAPGVTERLTQGLIDKSDLYPFEEAKLYGHNAIHFMLGTLGKQRDLELMSELRNHVDLICDGFSAFIDESGVALCRKYDGFDELFTPTGFREYAVDLLVRMTNPFLRDAIDRITRDLPRKLSWNDRVIGTMRVVTAQGVEPNILAKAAALAAREEFGPTREGVKSGLTALWGDVDTKESQTLINYILENI
jgi:mannitol-1-phosphate 5-dehydrogenase